MVFNDVKSGREESEDMMKFQKQSRWKGVDPVLFFKDEVVIKSIKSFFGIKESFPLEGHLVTRSTDNARRMYYISKSVKEIVELNEEVSEQLKIASLGIKMFVSIKYSQNLCSLPERSYFHWNYIHILLKKVYALYLFYFRKDIDQRMAVHVHIGCLMRVYHYCSHTSAHGYYMHLHQISTAYYNTEPSTLLILSTPVLVRKLRPWCPVAVLLCYLKVKLCFMRRLKEWHDDNVYLKNISGQKNADSILKDPATIAIVCWRGKGTMNVMVSPPDRKDLLERMAYRFGIKASTEEDEKLLSQV